MASDCKSTKTCTKCRVDQPLTNYTRERRDKPSLRAWCNACGLAYAKERRQITPERFKQNDARRRRSVNGWLIERLHHMRRNSKSRGHPPPEFKTKDDLRSFLDGSDFADLWREYVESGFQKDRCPSLDRLDNSVGYMRNNVRLVTWKENFDTWTLSEENRERCRRGLRRLPR